MAKAKEITGLDCAANALEWAAAVLRVRFEEVASLREAALDFSDIEGVHDMRVATRRLRSALRDFMPLMQKRPLKKVRRDLKQIADALGAVRDQDVAIVALEKLQTQAKPKPVKDGIKILLAERNAAREKARTDLAQAIAANHLTKLQEDFSIAIDEAVRKKKSARVVSFNEAGRDVVAASLQELCDLGAGLYAPFNVKTHHKMRIAAKRLRYAIELFTACWGKKIEPLAKEIAAMQSSLGEVHDCDVWIESLDRRLRDDSKSGAVNQNKHKATVWLLSEFVKNRTKNYRDALELWNEWETKNFTKRMQTIIS